MKLKPFIKITCVDGTTSRVNPAYICTMYDTKSTPTGGTTIRMINGHSYRVKETQEEILAKCGYAR